MTLPAHLEALRDEALRTSCEAWAIRQRWKLMPGIDRAGPCPVCGGRDRFAIHTKKDTFNCRRCGIAGHGVIDLVVATQQVEFTRACEIITGRSADAPVDEGKLEEARRRNAADEAKRDAEALRYREEARKRAYQVWIHAYRPGWNVGMSAGQSSAVAEYLARRGILLGMADHDFVRGDMIALRTIDSHPWRERRGDVWVTVHEGPAMIAAVQRPDGSFGAVHQTWLDAAQPKGRLILPPAADGSERASKKVLGAKKGGAIRLLTPGVPEAVGRAGRLPRTDRTERGARRIVMGEGIETTLTALAHNFEPETAYWAGVDLGNMAGRGARAETGGQLWDQPDLLDQDCFLPPDWCEELVYLCDSDEASNHTEEKVIRGLRRALILRGRARDQNPALPALTVSYVPPLGDGKDLNDLVRVG